MTGLRAKKPVVEPNRFRAIIYGNRGTGKTHLCCSIPNVYYIDTENILKYGKFVKMLLANDSVLIDIAEISEIIKEVKTLLTVKHNYKTLVIDSLSFPYGLLANTEAERLIAASKTTIEGTEFGANLAKAKRLTFHLGILLTRLDMNVIVTAHEKTKFRNSVEVGLIPDISDKMEYALGTVLHSRLQGTANKLFVEKSRYDEIKMSELLDVSDGYKALKDRFGEEIFVRDSIVEVLATPEQISELKRLIELIKVPDETVQKWMVSAKAQTLDEMNTQHIQKCIDHLISKTKGE